MHASYLHEHNSSSVRTTLIMLFFFFSLSLFFPRMIDNLTINLFGFFFSFDMHTVLNKCDLLQAKLQRGVRIRDSVPSFGDRKNDLPTATRCMFLYSYYIFYPQHLTLLYSSLFSFFSLDFQQHFKEISKNHSPLTRPFYVHLTSVIVRSRFLFVVFISKSDFRF